MSNVVPMTDADVAPLPLWYAKWPDGLIHGMFDCKPQPKRWHCTNRLLAGRAHALAGVGGSSKTTLQYQLACGSILQTLPWGWEVAARGSAALFLTEDTIDDSHRMLHAIGGRLADEQRRTLHGQLRVYQLAGLPARLLELNGARLTESSAFEWVMYQVSKLPKPVATSASTQRSASRKATRCRQRTSGASASSWTALRSSPGPASC